MRRMLIAAASAAVLMAMALPAAAGVPLSNRESIREKVMFKVHKIERNGVTIVRTHDGTRFEETRTGRDGKVHKDGGRWWVAGDRLCYMYDNWHRRQIMCGRVEIEGQTQIVIKFDDPPPPPPSDIPPEYIPPNDTPITVIEWRDAPPNDSPNGVGGGSPGGGGGPGGGGPGGGGPGGRN